MEYRNEHEFVARGKAHKGNISVPVTIIGSYSDWDHHPVHCKVIPDSDTSLEEFGYLFGQNAKLHLTGSTKSGKDLWIPRFRVTKTTQSGSQVSWEGIADLFVEGDLREFDPSNGRIICSAFVPPTPLAFPRQSYNSRFDGTITYSKNVERQGISWQTSLGEAELIDRYDYEREKIGFHKVLLRIQQCQVVIKMKKPNFVSLKPIVLKLQDELDPPLWLLSFLSRRRIAWYGAKIFFIPSKETGRDYREITVRRNQWIGYEPENHRVSSWIDLLVKREALVDGLFQQLYSNYKTFTHRKVIRQVIPHLLSAYEIGYVETRLGIAYSALETLVNGLDRGYILGPNRFRRLKKKLGTIIHEEIGDEDLAKNVVKKLPELRRQAYTDRLLRLFDEYNLDLTSLWPPDSDIPSEVRAIVSRRNSYIHQGKIDDYDLCLVDLYRILGLVEFWILKLLEYPPEEINYHAINSQVRLSS